MIYSGNPFKGYVKVHTHYYSNVLRSTSWLSAGIFRQVQYKVTQELVIKVADKENTKCNSMHLFLQVLQHSTFVCSLFWCICLGGHILQGCVFHCKINIALE